MHGNGADVMALIVRKERTGDEPGTCSKPWPALPAVQVENGELRLPGHV